uniref:EOG090X0266 n=1 Tax=Lynceus sp. MCZ IZ 141354 TaxID=1930659 RepID=A0A9N6WQX0_9CRUS|nr:EOG090X0266 [Lynceus sp. MCZ IZ 141354]
MDIDEDSIMVIDDSYACFDAIVSTKEGCKAMIEQGAFEKLTVVYVEELFKHDVALKLLSVLVNQNEGFWQEERVLCFHQILHRLSYEFYRDSGENKAMLCGYLARFLLNAPEIKKQDIVRRDWAKITLKGISDILSSKVNQSLRDPALHCAARLLELQGLEWSLSVGDVPKQFLLLLVNLACVEIRMKLEERTLAEAMTGGELLMSCYTIVELFISFMVTTPFSQFDDKQRDQVFCALKGAVNAVLEFFSHIVPSLTDNPFNSEDPVTHFLCASLRIVGAWFAEETSALNVNLELVPFYLNICKSLFQQKRANPSISLDPMRFMLPGFCHMIVEDDCRKILLQEKLHEILYEYLVYHWEAFYKWAEKQPNAPSDWLHRETEDESDEKQPLSHDSEAALCLICSILMNICVVQPQLVTEELVFSQLLKFCFLRIPELSKKTSHVVLFGNLAVLGLMVLRYHTWKVREGDSTVLKYIQGVLGFLWDAHNTEESAEARALVIAIRYKKYWPDLAELWFLGMQNLSNVLPNIPWVTDFIMDSGWPQEILKMLARIDKRGLDGATRQAYEDFLVCLARTSPKVVAVLHQNGVKTVCRNHTMKQLLQVVENIRTT